MRSTADAASAPLIADTHQMMLLDIAPNLPQLILNAYRMGQLHIMKQLIGHQRRNQLDIFQRNAACHQLV